VRAFFAEHVAPPPWLDRTRVRRAQAWASRHLIHVTTALFCASLPTAYAAARGARVLAATGRTKGPELERRVNETAQFVLDVLAEGGFEPHGSALRAIQKVRLMHAAVRRHVVALTLFADEVPINQEDLLGTLCAFSVVVVRAARLLGVRVSDEEAEDYYHLWRGVGAMLGIEEALLPEDFASARDLVVRIGERQFEPSAHGRALMAALLAGMEEHAAAFPWLPRHLVRYLVGERLADQLGVPAGDAFQAKLAVLRLLPRVSAPRALSPVIGRLLLGSVVASKLRGAPPTFAMPSTP
jgi:hypothetical protein